MSSQITATVSRITVFPIKSLDGVSVSQACITEGGSLEHDREWAITGEDGRFINGKSNPAVHRLRTHFDGQMEEVSFQISPDAPWRSFHLVLQHEEIETFLSAYFNQKVKLLREPGGKFLDIPVDGGATIISEASLHTVKDWFKLKDITETRCRFRASVELTGVPAFWEDHLFASAGNTVSFLIGSIAMEGVGPRERCVVPTRNPFHGEVIHGFAKQFAQFRKESLPSWSDVDAFPHFYFLATDCRFAPSQAGKQIYVGDEVIIVSGEELAN